MNTCVTDYPGKKNRNNSNIEKNDRESLYDFKTIESRWSKIWKSNPLFAADDNDVSRERRYVLDMFAYPSGDLHMGHAEAFVMTDVVARYWSMCGYNVLHPIGWDSFGLPAENAAIKHNMHPEEWTYRNIETQAASFRRYAVAVDWSRRLHTSDPEYYRWTQWLFKRFYERGLAYRKNSPVNWCPQDQTVLANEQVIQGRCERCGAIVTKKDLNQWYFKITDYADRLLDDIDKLEGHWPERVLNMQRNWIGRSSGVAVNFKIEAAKTDRGPKGIEVFTTRPDTLYGATFLVLAADADLAKEIVAENQREALENYRERVKKLSDVERQATNAARTGIFLGRYAINPVNGERLPLWASDYVLSHYGSGAIMAVPAHDQRDLDFARAFDLPIRPVITRQGDGALCEDPRQTGTAFTGEGVLMGSGAMDGLSTQEAKKKIVDLLESMGQGRATTNFRLRDWLISRQRFWGTPIPVIHCPDCGEVLVPDDQLPVRLPDNLKGQDLAPRGESPLAAVHDWVNVVCPQCHGPAVRDSDTMDTFVDSSWYYLRYCSPHDGQAAFDPKLTQSWMPVDRYVGGVEHAILHLLYSRFFTKVIKDMGLVSFDEPFKVLLNQGQVLNDGKAMSKSLGNGVELGEQLEHFGVDAVRLTMIFAGPPEDDIDWAEVSVSGSAKFLARAWRVAYDVDSAVDIEKGLGDRRLRQVVHRMIEECTELLEHSKFNVVVARLMGLTNATRKALDSGPGAGDAAVREAAETLAIILSLIAPYTAEDMWRLLNGERKNKLMGIDSYSVSKAKWPRADPALTARDAVIAVVQVKGKVKGRLEVSPDISDDELKRRALDVVAADLSGVTIRRVIVRAPRLVSIVV